MNESSICRTRLTDHTKALGPFLGEGEAAGQARTRASCNIQILFTLAPNGISVLHSLGGCITKLRALDAIMVSLFAALTAGGSLVTFPLYPVPITLQTCFTYLAGTILGSRLGALSQLIYVFLGSVGLPVYAGGRAGFGVLVGPTGGYLAGFVLGAFVIGKLCETKHNHSFAWILVSLIIATGVIYVAGVTQLFLWMRTSIAETIYWGVLPFLVGDSIKIVMASLVTLRVQRIPFVRSLSTSRDVTGSIQKY